MKNFLKILLGVIIAAAVVFTFIFLWNKSKEKPIEYETVNPEIRTISKKIILNGSVEPRDEVLIKPQVSGIITEIYKKPGEEVRKGEIIAKVKVVPDISQLNSAELSLNLAEINMEQMIKEYERTSRLFEAGVLSKETYKSTYTSYLKAIEELNNAKENIQIIKEGMSESTAQYSNTQIKSTISGMILDVPVKVGNSVIQTNTFNDGTTIATVADMTDLIFNGKVDETDVGKIAVGNNVNLIIGAMQNTNCPAVLEYISPKSTVSNGATTFEIKAAVTNTDSLFIRSGYSANGEIITTSKDSVLTVPESVVDFSDDSFFVYVKSGSDTDTKYTKTPIEIGISDGLYIEILSGVTKDDIIRGKQKTK